MEKYGIAWKLVCVNIFQDEMWKIKKSSKKIVRFTSKNYREGRDGMYSNIREYNFN